ncbi:glycosyltransferase [Candidatus Saccharibacteria bacterium]|nr:glycosyltransferase [Candidatus Saccharibacteria bacterium]
MKVAIVHDWMIGGGAEKVVLELHRMFPEAPIYTSYCTDEWRKKLDGKAVTGYLQNWPFPALRKFVPFLRGWWFSHLNLKDYDLVISSSGAEAKFIKVQGNTKHIAYIHAPTHYYWSRYDEYLKHPGFGLFDPLARLGLKILVGPMRRWDFKAAQRPDYLIANSNYTKQQIKKYYGRDSVVIHPPVDIDRFKLLNKSSIIRSGFLIVGRQTPYKRFDLAVAACTKLNLPLTVVGNGPDHKKLRRLAGPSVKFVQATDKELMGYFATAEAFIFPGLDDFGIVAVEAMACGTPVIAYKAGGALDYIIPGKTGEFFENQTAESLAKVLEKFDSTKFDSDKVSQTTAIFSADNFRTQIKSVLHAFNAK